MRVPFTKILNNWKVWGIPALIELLAPWQNKITGLAIISDYWQPGLNSFCSVSGALCAMFSFAFLHDQPRAQQRTWARWLVLLFVVSFLITLTFHLTVADYFYPEGGWLYIVRGIWVVSYILMFASSGGLIIALLLAGTKRGHSKRKKTSGEAPNARPGTASD